MKSLHQVLPRALEHIDCNQIFFLVAFTLAQKLDQAATVKLQMHFMNNQPIVMDRNTQERLALMKILEPEDSHYYKDLAAIKTGHECGCINQPTVN